MISAGDFRNGVTFEMDGQVVSIIEFQHVKPGKGAAFVRTKIRNVITGAVVEKTSGLGSTRFVPVTGGEDFMVGDIRVIPFNVSHDTAEPVAYAFEKGGRKAAVVTDTGFVSDEIFENIKDADLLVLEANHERNILLYSRYPYPVKHRILSDLGHLSNEAAAECLIRILTELGGSKIPRVLLAHLSKENNTPQQAMITVRNLLEEEGFFIGKDLELEVVDREETGRFLVV